MAVAAKVAAKATKKAAAKMTSSQKVRGWDAVAKAIAKKQGISIDAANRILGAAAKKYTAKTAAANPKVLRIAAVAKRLAMKG